MAKKKKNVPDGRKEKENAYESAGGRRKRKGKGKKQPKTNPHK